MIHFEYDPREFWGRICHWIETLIPSNLEYQFYDYKNILQPFPSYGTLSRMILHKGLELVETRNLSEEECHIVLNGIPILVIEVTPHVLQFFLSLPVAMYSIPQGSFDSSQSTELGHIVISENTIEPLNIDFIRIGLNELFENFETLNPCLLSQLYRESFGQIPPSSEAEVCDAFKLVMKRICNFLGLDLRKEFSCVKPSNFIAQFDPSLSRRSDYVIFNKDTPIGIVEIKKPSINDRVEIEPVNFETGKLNRYVNQLLLNMFMEKVRNGILSDAARSVLIRLEQPEIITTTIEGEVTTKLLPHFEFFEVSLYSSKPSYLEALIGFLFRAANEDNTDFFAKFPKIHATNKNLKQNPVRKSQNRNYSVTDENQYPYTGQNQNLFGGEGGMNRSSFVPVRLDPSNSNIVQTKSKLWKSVGQRTEKSTPMCYIPEVETVIQDPEKYFNAVFKIKTKYIEPYLLEKVVEPVICLKLFCRYASEEDNRTSQKMYKNEFESIQRLRSVKEYHNIYINHKEFIANVDGVSGKAILSRFIDNKLELNEDTYKQAKDQLEVVRRAGIDHGDIRKQNFLFDDILFLFDFSHAEFKPYDPTDELSNRELDHVFKKRSH